MPSGLFYSAMTMPLETTKNRMAFQNADANGKLAYRTVFQSLRKIATAEGPLALWSGFFPYYLRCGGHTVTMFLAVEWLRDMYFKFTD